MAEARAIVAVGLLCCAALAAVASASAACVADAACEAPRAEQEDAAMLSLRPRAHRAPSADCPKCTVQIAVGPEVVAAVEQQQQAIASFKSACDFVVCFDSGVHQLSGKTLALNSSFNRQDGGRVVWTSTSPSSPAVLSGGVQLTRWARCEESAHCPAGWDGVWVAQFSEVAGEGLAQDFLPPRQLWVEGERVGRTHVAPGGAWSTTDTGFASSWPASFFEQWVGNQVELVWPKQTKPWTSPRCIISAVTASGGYWSSQITVEPGCWAAVTSWNYGRRPPVPNFVENYPNDAPSPGQFMSTPQHLFYRPAAASKEPRDAWIPMQHQLMRVKHLDNHEVRQIQFRHGSWRQPSRPGGYVDGQAAVSNAGEPRGAIDIVASRSITFDQCTFVNIGTAYAISIGDRSQHVKVLRSRFTDCSGGAVKMGNIDEARAVSTNPADFDGHYLVQQNTMRHMAVEFHGAPAIVGFYVMSTTVEQNSIEHIGYTAISMGWGWGGHVYGPQTFMRDNHVSRNYMGSIMQTLNDGGCVYTLGPQPDSTMSGNYCQQNPAGAFYYLDNGSRFFQVYDNIAFSGPGQCVYLQGCCNQPALDISVSSMWCRSVGGISNGCSGQNCRVDDGSVHNLWGDWSHDAKAIISTAGATSTVPAGASSLSRSPSSA